MGSDIGNYASHARYWDWGGQDRTAEHAHWLRQAEKYGRNVLIPMCAWGETGAYLAQHGFHVTAFDITPEMVAEGKKRFGHVSGLLLCDGDVRDFHFEIPPADFCFSMDFGHLLTIEDVKKALTCIHAHLRTGGCLVVETELRSFKAKSSKTPLQTFLPSRQVYPYITVWKTGKTRSDAKTGRHYIAQTFYAQDENGHAESFAHSFYLQSYTCEVWREVFAACGFQIIGEYSNRALESWQSVGDGFCIFEAIKTP